MAARATHGAPRGLRPSARSACAAWYGRAAGSSAGDRAARGASARRTTGSRPQPSRRHPALASSARGRGGRRRLARRAKSLFQTLKEDRCPLPPRTRHRSGSSNGLVRIHVSGEETDGRYAVLENNVPQGDMPPLHVHHEEDEVFHVVDGEVTIFLPGQEIPLATGETFRAPRGIPHTFRVESPLAKVLVVCEPARFDGFVRAVSEPAPTEELPRVAARSTRSSSPRRRPSTGSSSSARPARCRRTRPVRAGRRPSRRVRVAPRAASRRPAARPVRGSPT